MRKNTFLQLAIICLFVIIALGSSNSSNPSSSGGWDGSDGQKVLQHVVQGANGGTYIGTFDSESAAKQAAIKAGYSYYNYYYATGQCYGYN